MSNHIPLQHNRIIRSSRFALLFMVAPLSSCLFIKDIKKPGLNDLLLSLLFGNQSNRIGVVSSDLGPSGRFTILRPEGLAMPYYTAIHSDASARYFGGRAYITNRLGRDSIQVLDPGLAFLTVQEYSTGSGTNPHDIAIADNGKGYISLYGSNRILVVQPESGAVLGSVSLAAYADSDGYPEVSGLDAEGNSIFAAIQNLDRNSAGATWPPAAGFSSLLIEIDANTDTVVGVYPMPFANPFSKLRRVDLFGEPHLVVACAGWLGFNQRLDGAILAFRLSTRSFRSPLYLETSAGGDLLDVVVKDDSTAYANVLFSDFSSAIQRFDPSTGRHASDLAFYPSSGGYASGMLLTPDNRLYVGDTTYTEPGVMIYDTDAGDGRLTALPVPVGLRPTDLIYIP